MFALDVAHHGGFQLGTITALETLVHLFFIFCHSLTYFGVPVSSAVQIKFFPTFETGQITSKIIWIILGVLTIGSIVCVPHPVFRTRIFFSEIYGTKLNDLIEIIRLSIGAYLPLWSIDISESPVKVSSYCCCSSLYCSLLYADPSM